MYKVIYKKQVVKFIKKRVPTDKERILNQIDKLKKNPYPTNESLDIKKLQAQNGFRLRVGDYRFLYDVIDDELVIYMEDANNRGDIY